jgi:hypothetical protein
MISLTVWFSATVNGGPMKIVIETYDSHRTNVLAEATWDMLITKGYHMISARP